MHRSSKRLLAAAILLAWLPALVPAAYSAVWQWSETASSNASIDPQISWREGQPPSSINDSARAMMAALASYRDDISGLLTTTGTSTAYLVTTNQGLCASPSTVPQDGQQVALRFNLTNGTAPTMAADSCSIYPIQTSPGVAVSSGVLVSGAPYRLTFSVSNSSWLLQGFYSTTQVIPDASLAYGKLKQPSTTSLLLGSPSVGAQTISTAANNGSGLIRITVASTTGFATGNKKTVSGVVGTVEANNYWTITVIDATHIDLQGSTFTNAYVSGGTIGGFYEEITLGAGLNMVGNVLSSPAFPPPGLFKNLSIKVTGNTGATVNADFVSTTNGTVFQTVAVSSCAINMATAGAGGIDTGAIAQATWYAVWVIVQANGTTSCEASLQGTANGTFLANLPSGYTYYARVGWLRTAPSVAQLLGTWQLGRKARYVVGLAQTTGLPVMISGISGSLTTPTWSAVAWANFFPSTAGDLNVVLSSGGVTLAGVMAAPSNSYGAFGSTSNPPPLVFNTAGNVPGGIAGSQEGWFFPESSSIYYASGDSNGLLAAKGWEDNL